MKQNHHKLELIIYQQCANYLSLNTNDNYILFQTDGYGLIQLCGYIPKICVDVKHHGQSNQPILVMVENQ